MAIPLTKRSKEGAVYVRPAVVESNIDGTLGQETEELIRRARVPDRHSAEYLRSECLVHVIRHAIRSGDDSRYNSLLPILLLRCEANLNSKISQHVPNADYVREEVLGEFSVLFAGEAEDDPPDELDYYEVRFNHAFRTLRCEVLRRECKNTNRAKVLSDGSETDDERARSSNLPACRPTQEDGLLLADLATSFSRLPEKIQNAMALKELGLAIGSDDHKKDLADGKDTIAARCRVSGRTVRDWLTRAHTHIEQTRQEES